MIPAIPNPRSSGASVRHSPPERGGLSFHANAGLHLGAYAALVVAVFAVYWPGLFGPFLLDDFTSILTNPFVAVREWDVDALWHAAGSGTSGLLGRPLPYLSFALNHWFAGGFEPAAFKLTNVAIHALNAVLVGFVARALVVAVSANPRRAAAVGLVAAMLWALHPLQLTSVLYVVQRMTSLSALGVLIGLLIYLLARARLDRYPRAAPLGMAAALLVGCSLGLLSKENAPLVFLYAAVLEFGLLSRDSLRVGHRRLIIGVFALGAVGGGVVALVAVALEPGMILNAYVERDYGPLERLLTQARVLFFYIGLIVVPRLGEFALVHDDIVASTSVFEPLSTALALAVWVAVIVTVAVAAWRDRRWRIVVFAFGWFFAGHAMESSVIALDLVHEHRNYLPLFGFAFAMAYVVCAGASARFGPSADGGKLSTRAARFGRPIAVIALGTALAVTTWSRADLWADEERLTAHWIQSHPDSNRAYGLRAQYLVNSGAPVERVYPGLAAYALRDDGNVSALVQMLTMLTERTHGTPELRPLAIRAADAARIQASLTNAARWPTSGPAMLAAQRAVMEALEWRVASTPVNAITVRTLYGLSDCVRANTPRCGGLADDLERWLSLTLSGARTQGEFAAVLYGARARLRASFGRPGVESDLMEAVDADGRTVRYHLELIRFYEVAGRDDDASAALSNACRSVRGRFAKQQLDVLVQRFAARGWAVLSCR